MFNTSTPQVTIPVDSDFLLMFVDDTGQLVPFAFAKTTVQSDLNRGLDPKLRLAVRARNVNVQARFFSEKKKNRYWRYRKTVGLTFRAYQTIQTRQWAYPRIPFQKSIMSDKKHPTDQAHCHAC